MNAQIEGGRVSYVDIFLEGKRITVPSRWTVAAKK